MLKNDKNGLGMRAHNYKLNIESHLDMSEGYNEAYKNFVLWLTRD